MRVDDAHWLTVEEEGLPPVLKLPSVRKNQLDVPFPLGIVWHWTAGRGGTPEFARALANEIRTYDKSKDRAASWHVLVAKDGRLFQSVAFNEGTWHVGRPGRIGGKPKLPPEAPWDGRLFANINRATIGVELENAGKLERVQERYYCWPYWMDPSAPAELRRPDSAYEVLSSRAVAYKGEFYDGFPPAQVQAAQRLLAALARKYKWTRAVSQYGHFHFDPTRKTDPGPLWVEGILPQMLDSIFGPE